MRERKNKTEDVPALARPFWSGTITFGLVSIPVNLFPASRDSKVSLKMLGSDGEPLKRDYYSPQSGSELEGSEMVRGFEADNGKYVTISDEELDRLAPEMSRDIHLRVFVARREISPVFFQKAYILTPADKLGKAYRLLAKTMEGANRAGIATFVMHGKEYLVAIFSLNGILRAETLRFSDEIRTPSSLGLPAKKNKASAKLVRTLGSAIDSLKKQSLDLKSMRDQYAERMMKLIESKRAKSEDIVETTPPRKQPAQVVDLMEVLKRNLEQTGKRKQKKSSS